MVAKQHRVLLMRVGRMTQYDSKMLKKVKKAIEGLGAKPSRAPMRQFFADRFAFTKNATILAASEG